MADTQKNAPTATPEEVQQHRAAQESEYGTYVAVAPITFNGASAYLPGDPVPTTNVELHGYAEQGLVAKINSAEGKRLIAAVHEAGAAAATNTTQEAPIPVSLSVPVPDGK